MSKKPPAALMSYAHCDDTDRHLTTFRERLSQEVQVQIGREFPIFQDTKDIQWGQSWQQRINDSLDEITFLIPIITPSFFNSEPCRTELERFLERETRLGRNDLILPVYFVETDLLSDPELRATDELAEVIASRQWVDWRDLRFELFTNPQVRKMLAQLAVQIRNALPRILRTKKIVPKVPTARNTRSTVVTTGAGSEQPTESPTAKKQPPVCIVDRIDGDFATISEAIQNVEPGTRILVRRGVYQEALIIDKPLEIIGDGKSGEVVIEIAGMSVIQFQTTFGRIVNLSLQQMGGGKWYCVDIPQGRLELEDCKITSHSLACVAIHGDADPRLRRNRIHDSKDGAGVFVYENAQGTLEDNDIFGNVLAAIEIKEGANPTVRHNRIHDNKGGGVYVHEGGQGRLEDNDIFGNDLSEVAIKTNGNPALLRNRIHESKRGSGVYVSQGGQGMFEENEIFSNAYSGVSSRSDSNPVVRNNRINKNGHYGIYINENGGGTFEANDLTENTKGAWFIGEGSQAKVTRVDNKE